MNDEHFIGYCEIHCETERALFVGRDVNRMLDLAGNPKGFKHVNSEQFFSVRHDMKTLCDLARERIRNPPVCKIIQFPNRTTDAANGLNGEFNDSP